MWVEIPQSSAHTNVNVTGDSHFMKGQTSGSQTFMSCGPILILSCEYLIHCDTWVMQYHGKAI